MDYYKILGLDPKTANHDDINNAFRVLSVDNHPMKQKTNLAGSMIKFNKICEAYQVLSNIQYKRIYDMYGEDGLKNGVTNPADGTHSGSYAYYGNSIEIFEAFFGSKNPYTDNFFVSTRKEQELWKKRADDPQDIEVVLSCTLSEFYNGSLKTATYRREILQKDGVTPDRIEENLIIDVKPGYDADTVLVFPSKGYQIYSLQRSALKVSFILDDQINLNYQRKGDDLIYTHTMKIEDAILSKPFQLQTLDGRYINITLDKMITPQTVNLVKGEGMPKKNNNAEKGDLHIKFNIVFPKEIKYQYKQEIISLLDE